ncbi:mitochondrial processing peptidase beta subunit [Reticulomyxa filosa]|uniref:Mitochondrial processing peptidase beta subunit n=1 Tax=Reticulomyxa filosa TaxID=46433 RepID=X6NY15_RETFI|nr:mitochondrial processing peptidase beta subunit [Reticulomyxa filosa]|eukprot:ETO30773.1 mitochondrial processing peptidase beta subunit [Reticulomyxa filosa]
MKGGPNDQTQTNIIFKKKIKIEKMENVYTETKEELIFDHLHENCFQDCALGRTILGPVENIQRINRDDLLEYINQYYTADNMVIVATGAVDHEKFVNLIKEKFQKVLPKNPHRPVLLFLTLQYILFTQT